jgi:hypothetical protein
MNDRHCPAPTFLFLAGAYAGLATPFFAVWEIAQLPLYTIWRERSFTQNIAAALHCTIGDAVIAFVAFFVALWAAFLLGFRRRIWMIGAIAVAEGLVATLVLEVLSTQVWNRWAYAPGMPIIPIADVGFSPVLQCLVVPSVALFLVRRKIEHGGPQLS